MKKCFEVASSIYQEFDPPWLNNDLIAFDAGDNDIDVTVRFCIRLLKQRGAWFFLGQNFGPCFEIDNVCTICVGSRDHKEKRELAAFVLEMTGLSSVSKNGRIFIDLFASRAYIEAMTAKSKGMEGKE